MATATQTKQPKTEPALRQFQPGDIVEGENPVGNTIRGMVQDVGLKWLRLADKKGGIDLATARLIESTTEEPEFFSLPQLLRDNLGFQPLDLYGETEPELDQEPIEYRGWQIGTESPNGGMLSVDICSPEGEWWSRDTEFTEPTFDYHDYEGAIAWAKGCIDQAIALQEKLSGQFTLETGIPVETELTPTAVELIPAEPTARLSQLEDDVQAGLGLIEKGKARIWAAAQAIRSEELWKLNGHESFEAYCKARWGWSKSNANENALAGEVLRTLPGIPVEELPTSTSAMAELNKVPEAQRVEVLEKAREANGKPTAKAIREVIEPSVVPEEDPIYFDATGQPIAVGDTVISTAAHGLTGTVEAIEPESFLPVVIRTATGQTKARPGSLQVVDDELPAIPAEIAQQPASPDADALGRVQTVLEPSDARYGVGDVVVDRYRPYLPLIVAETSETQACCWDTFDETWIGWGQLEPYEGETSLSLESIVQGRLQRLLQVAGKDAVLSLLEEV